MPDSTYDASTYADGYWHAEDEVFLPWMARHSPNTTSQPTQQPSALGGRYSFMADLNPYPEFHVPAPGCCRPAPVREHAIGRRADRLAR